MKPDELALLRAVAAADGRRVCAVVSDFIAANGTPVKRCHYLLRKWTDKGWYDYGVRLDMGWLTDEGRKAAHDITGV